MTSGCHTTSPEPELIYTCGVKPLNKTDQHKDRIHSLLNYERPYMVSSRAGARNNKEGVSV